MIAKKQYLKERLLDVKYDRIEQGLGLGLQEVDEWLRFKRGNFNICVGHANTGKTTVVVFLMLAYALKHNLRWLIFSSENTDYSIVRKLLEFKTGKPVQKLPDAQIEEELHWIDQHFKIMQVDKIYTARTLMEEAKAIKDAWNYDGILIDPYNSLAKDAALLRQVGGHEYDYQIASEMRLFAKENNVTVWLNAHAVTESLRKTHDKDHQFAGLPKPCGMADIEGGGKWGNRADDVISIHRYTSSADRWMVSDVHVKKVKETETGGRPTVEDAPIALRMTQGNCGFTIAGLDVIEEIVKSIKPKVEIPTIDPELAF